MSQSFSATEETQHHSSRDSSSAHRPVAALSLASLDSTARSLWRTLFDGSAITSTDAAHHTRREPFLKRPFDMCLAILGLITSAPLWALIAMAIKLEDGGPVFYTQDRWGRGCEPFKTRKFRTMAANADKQVGVKPAIEKDGYITRVGRVLRATGMDELPQFINILKGDMSFVGPRALAVDEIVDDGNGNHKSYTELPMFGERHAVRPGLTGVATIYTPKYCSPRRKFRYDLVYVRRQSFWLDLRLILLSFWISFRGKWETRDTKL